MQPDRTSEPRSGGADARERALEALRSGRRFLLSGHVRPDGDCIGAEAALKRVLEASGKEARILNPHPPEARYDFLASRCEYGAYEGEPLPEHDVAVLLDISELDRCGDLAAPLRAAPSTKVVVDHHLFHGEPWWDAAYVDVDASATGVLVHRIARALGVALDEVAALGVFTSIVTDTGWFKYSNTDGETLRIASEMLDAGVRSHEVYRAIYQRNESSQPYALAHVLERLEYHGGGRVAIVDLPLSAATGGELADSDAVLDILRSVEGVEVVLFLREVEPGVHKLSARSKSDYDVNALARRFGGGGHRKASGATLEGEIAAVRRELLEAAAGGFGPDREAGG